MEENFKNLYLAGKIEFEAIDDYVEKWNFGEEDCRLGQHLGLNAEEEDVWVSDSEEALKMLLDSQKKS